jgi:hypothetical protein
MVGKPFASLPGQRLVKLANEALRVALRGDLLRLRKIADKLVTWGMGALSEPSGKLADRLDGKPAQVIDRRNAPVDEMADAQLHLIASGGLT